MVVYVLDASALLRWIDEDSGFARINEIFIAHLLGSNRIAMSTLHLGEVLGVLLKRYGVQAVRELHRMVETLEVEVVPATLERTERSALLRLRFKIPYVDSFAAELASASPDHILLTGDFDFKPLENNIRIEFLPTKQKYP